MQTFHIHIKGIVQGVGFRPFVYKYALQENLKGWVNNTSDGVHIELNVKEHIAKNFLHLLLAHLPPLAIVTSSAIFEVEFMAYTSFKIIKSAATQKPNLLLTPDVALCNDCRKELYKITDKRYHYPFITCTNCGPRYSIITELPYDRPYTTMSGFSMCNSCQIEYDNPLERRHFSQTNSCPDCKIEMQLYENGELQENFIDLRYITESWRLGKIVAIKGIGGYLLTCDATNLKTVHKLRTRKNRPKKPFALMYPDVKSIQKDTLLSKEEEKELTSIQAPIVLLKTRDSLVSGIAISAINSGLSRIGVMLPYTPLYELLLQDFGRPIVATSGNSTGATIVYTDKKALEELSQIADIIVLNNRDIVIPQDDGVLQFSKKYKQKIVLRRSRGKAPTYINLELELQKESVFASGAMLKSTFGIQNLQNTYVSQYLGNTANYDTQLNYEATFSHFQKVFQLKFDKVVVDKHPDYFTTRFGKKLAQKHHSKYYSLQHHKAHFYAVLGENNLLHTQENILGVIWDGTGLGDDNNIWGGEFFSFQNKKMKRVHHIDEFCFILGDKMAKEPRISALAIAGKIKGIDEFIKEKFTKTEWTIYKKLLQKQKLKSTSMGRLFDAVSSLLFDINVHSYEAEAAMILEKEASEYYYKHKESKIESYINTATLPDNFVVFLFENIIKDLKNSIDKQLIASKFHITLVDYILIIAQQLSIKKIAFSGGVFQNALLVDLIIDKMKTDYKLYFHKEFSPNDEGIAFGQLMYMSCKNKKY